VKEALGLRLNFGGQDKLSELGQLGAIRCDHVQVLLRSSLDQFASRACLPEVVR